MNCIEHQRGLLLSLSHDLGAEHRALAILGEGNTSARLEDGRHSFLVKASGSSLGTLTHADLVECRFEGLLSLMDRDSATDAQIDEVILGCRTEPEAKRPSVEALFHAYLLTLLGIKFVGHTHPEAVNAILCSTQARAFAQNRVFPDEIVCCGAESVFVEYCDPGLKLAQSIRRETQAYLERNGGIPPRVILLQNHGIITLGASAEAVKAAMFMAVKAARIFLGAAQLGGPVFLSKETIERIGNRTDEHYRQRALKLS